MEIIIQLKELLALGYTNIAQIEEYFDNEQKYDELIFDIQSSVDNQNKICKFILDTCLEKNEKQRVIQLLLELYRRKEDDCSLYFEPLYEWILNNMFDTIFYEYSICYKFSELLYRIANDYNKVYEDIIAQIDINRSITTQIAVCSTYSFSNQFFQNEKLTRIFIEKISETLKNNFSDMLVEDFNHFMLEPLMRFGYSQEINNLEI